MTREEKWDRRFLALAKFISDWSYDPSTKVGAVVVDKKNRIVSLGYNGFPIGTNDDIRIYNDRDSKYSKTIHAEINALIFAKETAGCTLYTWPFCPCDRCSTQIIQHEISRVVFNKTNVERWLKPISLAKQYMTEAGIIITEYE